MEFGIFSQMHVPPWDEEHDRFMRELEVSEAVEAAGFKYNWAPEHHFLENYSHQPAPEVFLSWVAARTRRLHVGTAITNITAAVNHPARVAERIATMDHLSEGRVEFGTGRGSSSAEWGGFAIPSAAETKPMWRESLEQIPRMWRDEP
ncbi:MAG: LLM class flavin-dependent oxidoreductase, partial [Deltaproteobacteria bacterium]|nr:LLM class flavin-dependent oxidoreductase [Deltaproteobacteria bacterium]